jgi:hypothetical protein
MIPLKIENQAQKRKEINETNGEERSKIGKRRRAVRLFSKGKINGSVTKTLFFAYWPASLALLVVSIHVFENIRIPV